MTNFLNRAEMLGLGNLLNSNSTSPTATTNTYSGIITIDQLINAPSAQGSIYIQNNLVRAKNLGTPYPAEPTITLKQFVDELVGALAELFRARGYERIADYLLSQHDLDSVFGQLATRMLQMHQETQARESLIAKYLRINAGSSSLLTENQVDLTYADSSSSVTSMSSGQIGELNNILTGYSDGTGSHQGINAVSKSITGASLQPTEDALAQLATTAEFLDPDNSQIQAGITAANSIAQTMQNTVSSSNTNLALIQNAQVNSQGYTDSSSLLSTAQTGSYSAATYQQSSLTNALADLTNNIVNPNTSGAQPLYPPLFVPGQSYAPGTFYTKGSEVYMVTSNSGLQNQTLGVTSTSSGTSAVDTGYQPIGGAYQMKSLTQDANTYINYLQNNGQVNYVQGSTYSAGQNISFNGQSYYTTTGLTSAQQFQTQTYKVGDLISQNGQIYQYLGQGTPPPKSYTYSPTTSYKAGDYVSYSGQIYLVKSDVNAPPDFNGGWKYNSGDTVSYNGQIYKENGSNSNYSVSFTGTATSSSGQTSDASAVVGLDPQGTTYSSPLNLKNLNFSVTGINFSSPNVSAFVQYSDGTYATINSSTPIRKDIVAVNYPAQANTPNQDSSFSVVPTSPVSNSSYALYTAPSSSQQPLKVVNFSAGASYNAGDVISYNGTYYVAKAAGQFTIPKDKTFDPRGDYGYGAQVAYNGVLYQRTGASYWTDVRYVDSSGNRVSFYFIPGEPPLRYTDYPDGSYKQSNDGSLSGLTFKFNGSNYMYANVTYTWGETATINSQDIDGNVAAINYVAGLTPDRFANIWNNLGPADPSDSNANPVQSSNFSTYDPSADTARWQTDDPSTDSTHWIAGVSPGLSQAQSNLQTTLKLLKSLFDTSSMVTGTRQDFLSITGSMPQDGSTPVIKAFSIQQAEALELKQKQDSLTAMTNLLNQSPPNFSQVKTNATALQSQIKSQITSSSIQDPNQQWGAILQSLSTLISQCNNGDQTGALATLGTVVTPPSSSGDGTDSTSANAAMSGNPPATLQVEFLMQYSTLSPSDIGDNVAQSIQVNGQTDLDNSPYLGTLQKLQAFQQLVQRVNSGDTSEPAAQLFNEMQNTLQDLYDSQSLTGTPIFSQADYAAAQTHLAHAMLTRGNGGINITLSLAQVEALPNSDARKGTLLGLYRDMYKAIGDINNFNAVNNYIAGQNPPPAGQGTGYLAQVAGDMSSLSSSASGINTPETGHQQRRRLLQFWGIPIGIQRSRKFTSGDSFTSLKNTYDNIKSQVTSMMTNLNTDLTFAANQYVGDAYVAPPAGQSTPASQRVVYNGQFYKSLTTTNDRPDVGASRQPPTWELMTFNVNRGRTYQFGDVVTYNGQMFRCIDSNMPSSSDPTTIPGSTFSRNNWAQISYQTGYHYLAGDTVLVQQNGQYIPYVAKVEYTAGDSSDLNNTALWNVGYNNAVTVNSSGQIQAAATLGGMSANVNGGNTQFNGNLTANQLSGLAFSTLNNSQNGAVGAAFNGWVSNNSQFLNSGTAGGTATNYDGMQFFNPAMQTATSLMQTMQMIDLFFYAHQQFTISGGGNYYTGYTSPIISLTWGASDEGGSNAYNSVTNPQIFDASAARQVFSVSSDHNMGNTTSPSWRDAEDKITTSLYQASRALAGQLKSQVSSFQNNFNTMKLQVQQEAYRLLAKAFVNTTDIQASLTQLFRNAPLTDDEKKLLAKILAVVMSLLIAILGANPQIRGAFTQQTVVTGKSPTGQPQTSSQWVFNDALSSVRISKTFANNLIAKAIALADQLLSEKKRSSSVSDDRLSTNDYLNMQAFAEGQKEALENLDAQNSQARQRV